ncbi:MAG TPA: AAA family ATPase [Planctomycetota bacterium]
MSTPSRRTPDPKKPSPATDWGFNERVLGSRHVRTVYIWGPPGFGKTYAAYRVALNGPLYALTLTEDTPAAELRGHYLPVGERMEWRDGPVVLAMRAGARLVLNEVSHAGPDCLSFLHPILENPDTAMLTLPTGETVRPAPGFKCFVTDNVPPEELPLALRDRFDVVLEVREPHPAALAGLDPRLLGLAVRSFSLEPERRVSIRGWLSVQRLLPEFSLREALMAVFGPARGGQIHDALLLGEAQN